MLSETEERAQNAETSISDLELKLKEAFEKIRFLEKKTLIQEPVSEETNNEKANEETNKEESTNEKSDEPVKESP